MIFRDTLRGSELRIWEAVFAAEFVREFDEAVKIRQELNLRSGQRGMSAFDQVAEQFANGERAWHVADIAVQKYRDRRKEEIELAKLEDEEK